MKRTLRTLVLSSLAVTVVAAAAHAYSLIGVRWAKAVQPADFRYNVSGKPSTSQCLTSSQLDSTALGGISAWRGVEYVGTTTKKANRQDGTNVLGWGKLGGQTLGITNFLNYTNYNTYECLESGLRNLVEVDVRLSSTFRWTAPTVGCPCPTGSAFYLDSVSMHEFGHAIGLCHTSTASSLMYASVAPCDHKTKGADENAGENALCY